RDRLGSLILVQPEEDAFADWRAGALLSLSLFTSTTIVLPVLGYAFYSQSARTREVERTYEDAQSRLETALNRGRCGLLDWDLARGRMFWSTSMYEILGMQPREALLGFGEVSRLVHPEDCDLFNLAETLLNGEATAVDQVFRMKHASGDWVWLRARAEIVHPPDGGTPHLIGIAVDITEQRRLAERSATADLRLRDAIETISEAFVLWDADNRLVMCNTKYQELHGLADEMVRPGRSYHSVMAAARRPVVHKQIKPESRPEEGARTYE